MYKCYPFQGRKEKGGPRELQGHEAHGGSYNWEKVPHFAALQRERSKHVTFPPLPPTSSGDARLKNSKLERYRVNRCFVS
jgi:hypothetical protein